MTRIITTGSSVSGTRTKYVADSKLSHIETESRSLFSSDADNLTRSQADRLLNGGKGTPERGDLYELVISLEEKDYNRLGETIKERNTAFQSTIQNGLARFWEELGVSDVRYAGAIHLNTKNPHAHIVINKNVIDTKSGNEFRLERIPFSWLVRKDEENSQLAELFATELAKKTMAAPPEQIKTIASKDSNNLPLRENTNDARIEAALESLSKFRNINPKWVEMLTENNTLYVNRKGGLTFVKRDEKGVVTGFTFETGRASQDDDKGYFYIGNPRTASHFVLTESPRESLSLLELTGNRDLSNVCFIACDGGTPPKAFVELIKTRVNASPVRLVWAFGLDREGRQKSESYAAFREEILAAHENENKKLEFVSYAPKAAFGKTWNEQVGWRNAAGEFKAFMKVVESVGGIKRDDTLTADRAAVATYAEATEEMLTRVRVAPTGEDNQFVVFEKRSGEADREIGRFLEIEEETGTKKFSIVSINGAAHDEADSFDDEFLAISRIEDLSIAAIEAAYIAELERRETVAAAELKNDAEKEEAQDQAEIDEIVSEAEQINDAEALELAPAEKVLPPIESKPKFSLPPKEITNRLKQIPLEEVMPRLDLALVFDSERKEYVYRDGGKQFKIKVTGDLFCDRFDDMRGGRGSVDLVMHVQGSNFADARSWLLDNFGTEYVSNPEALPKARVEKKAKEREALVMPSRNENNLEKVTTYLTSERGISLELVNQLVDQGIIYANSYKSAVFVHRAPDGERITGASWRATDGNGRADVTGTNKDEGWFYIGNFQKATRFIITEAPIEVLSYYELHRDELNLENTTVLAVSGSSVPVALLAKIQAFAGENAELILATNNDQAGQKAFFALLEKTGRFVQNRHKAAYLAGELEMTEFDGSIAVRVPQLEDWNDELKAARAETEREADAEHILAEISQTEEEEREIVQTQAKAAVIDKASEKELGKSESSELSNRLNELENTEFVRILVTDSESPHLSITEEKPLEFESIEKFDAFLRDTPYPSGGVYKTAGEIHLSNGDIFKGRFDIGGRHPITSLTEFIENYRRFLVDYAVENPNLKNEYLEEAIWIEELGAVLNRQALKEQSALSRGAEVSNYEQRQIRTVNIFLPNDIKGQGSAQILLARDEGEANFRLGFRVETANFRAEELPRRDTEAFAQGKAAIGAGSDRLRLALYERWQELGAPQFALEDIRGGAAGEAKIVSYLLHKVELMERANGNRFDFEPSFAIKPQMSETDIKAVTEWEKRTDANQYTSETAVFRNNYDDRQLKNALYRLVNDGVIDVKTEGDKLLIKGGSPLTEKAKELFSETISPINAFEAGSQNAQEISVPPAGLKTEVAEAQERVSATIEIGLDAARDYQLIKENPLTSLRNKKVNSLHEAFNEAYRVNLSNLAGVEFDEDTYTARIGQIKNYSVAGSDEENRQRTTLAIDFGKVTQEYTLSQLVSENLISEANFARLMSIKNLITQTTTALSKEAELQGLPGTQSRAHAGGMIKVAAEYETEDSLAFAIKPRYSEGDYILFVSGEANAVTLGKERVIPGDRETPADIVFDEQKVKEFASFGEAIAHLVGDELNNKKALEAEAEQDLKLQKSQESLAEQVQPATDLQKVKSLATETSADEVSITKISLNESPHLIKFERATVREFERFMGRMKAAFPENPRKSLVEITLSNGLTDQIDYYGPKGLPEGASLLAHYQERLAYERQNLAEEIDNPIFDEKRLDELHEGLNQKTIVTRLLEAEANKNQIRTVEENREAQEVAEQPSLDTARRSALEASVGGFLLRHGVITPDYNFEKTDEGKNNALVNQFHQVEIRTDTENKIVTLAVKDNRGGASDTGEREYEIQAVLSFKLDKNSAKFVGMWGNDRDDNFRELGTTEAAEIMTRLDALAWTWESNIPEQTEDRATEEIKTAAAETEQKNNEWIEAREKGVGAATGRLIERIEKRGYRIAFGAADSETHDTLAGIAPVLPERFQKAGLTIDKMQFRVERWEHITRADVQANKDKVFLFGDNLQGWGNAGQAAAMRGEENALGIPTKRSPAMTPASFFNDADFDSNKEAIDLAFARLARFAPQTTVVIPSAGLGTGLAQMANRAPQTFAYLNEKLAAITLETNQQIKNTYQPLGEEPKGVKTGTRGLAEAVRTTLGDGLAVGDNRAFNALAEEHFGGTRAAGRFTSRDAYDALELGVNAYLLDNRDRLLSQEPQKTLQELRGLLKKLPTQTDRTDEQLKFQQFSTPPTESYVAFLAAGIKEGDYLTEPSAGNGGLAVWAKNSTGVQVHVNEITENRAGILKMLGFENVTRQDAQFLNDTLPQNIRPTVILMNPPFSSTGGRTEKNRTKYGAEHITDALTRLETGGRLVAIVGEGMAMDKPTFANWWQSVMNKYNVRANVGIDGEEYAKYGTTFGNQILVIDKTGSTPGATFAEQVENVKTGQFKKLDQALEVLLPLGAERRNQIGAAKPELTAAIPSLNKLNNAPQQELFAKKLAPAAKSTLLLPELRMLTKAEFEVYEQNQTVFSELGFETTPFKGREIALKTVPQEKFLKSAENEGFVSSQIKLFEKLLRTPQLLEKYNKISASEAEGINSSVDAMKRTLAEYAESQAAEDKRLPNVIGYQASNAQESNDSTIVIDVTSRSNSWSKELSPFLLRNIPLYNGKIAKNMENAWQYSKVYKEMTDAQGNPNEKYYEWANQGWSEQRGNRYPMGKGAVPLYSYWNNEKLGYLEARQQIYLPLYRDAVKKTEAYQKLKEIYRESGGNITLKDFDGYDYRAKGMTLRDVLLNPERPCGHGFILAMMLTYGDDFTVEDVLGKSVQKQAAQENKNLNNEVNNEGHEIGNQNTPAASVGTDLPHSSGRNGKESVLSGNGIKTERISGSRTDASDVPFDANQSAAGNESFSGGKPGTAAASLNGRNGTSLERERTQGNSASGEADAGRGETLRLENISLIGTNFFNFERKFGKEFETVAKFEEAVNSYRELQGEFYVKSTLKLSDNTGVALNININSDDAGKFNLQRHFETLLAKQKEDSSPVPDKVKENAVALTEKALSAITESPEASAAAGTQKIAPQKLNVNSEESPEPKPSLENLIEIGSQKIRRENVGVGTIKYAPAKFKGGVEHPGDIVESASMGAVEPPDITYTPQLDPKIVAEGKLSNLQYETVVYAGQRHQMRLPDGSRAGYFIGDGTGVGKGRELAGIALDNWNQNNKRILWLSINYDLVPSADRDLKDLGAEIPLASLNRHEVKADLNETVGDGILFASYATLIGKGKDGTKRLDQITAWLGENGVLMFDEGHLAKNAVPEGVAEASQRGEAVVDLQLGEKSNPNWRIVYSSATGATTVRNMAYMQRLGLWGEGTGFPGGFVEFQNTIEKGGVGAMEMVARDLKSAGMYCSRSLSYRGVDYGQTHHTLTPEQVEIYNSAAAAWGVVVQHFDRSLEDTGADGRARAFAMSRLWSSQQLFFRQLLTAMKVPALIERTEEVLANGSIYTDEKGVEHRVPAQVVIGLIGTGEARTKEQISKAAQFGLDLDELDFSPKQILMNLVEKAYPTHRYTEKTQGERTIKVKLTDEDGRPIESQEAIAKRDALLQDLEEKLRLPDNPLDQIINHFGENFVAEITGRDKRIIIDPETGQKKYVKRAREGVAMDKASQDEMLAFQAGRKPVAIISQSASTGISLHAELKPLLNNYVTQGRMTREQADNVLGYWNEHKDTVGTMDLMKEQGADVFRRVHITLETAWSADTQMQTFGRDHRSNQVLPPEYDLLSTNLGGEKRFLATIAKRLGTMGALTKGDRDQAGGGDLLQYDFENQYGENAAKKIVKLLERGNPKLISLLPDDPQNGRARNGLDLLYTMGLAKRDGELLVVKEETHKELKVTTFLNRVLILDVDTQNVLFDAFTREMEAIIEHDKELGLFDEGVRDIEGTNIRLAENPRVVTADKYTGAATKYFKVLADEPTHPVTLTELAGRNQTIKFAGIEIEQSDSRKGKFFQQINSHNIIYAEFVATRTNAESGGLYEVYRYARPQGWAEEIIKESDLKEKYIEVNLAQVMSFGKDKPMMSAAEWWNKEVAATPEVKTTTVHIIGGAVLPIWQRLNSTNEKGDQISLKTVRVETEEGERIVGVRIPPMQINRVLRDLGVQQSMKTPQEVYDGVLEHGESVQLVGGLKLQRTFLNRQPAIELTGISMYQRTEVENMGLFKETRNYNLKHFVPTEEEKAITVLTKLLERYPAVSRRDNQQEDDLASENIIDSPSAESERTKTAPSSLMANLKTAAEKLKNELKENQSRLDNAGLPEGALASVNTAPSRLFTERAAGLADRPLSAYWWMIKAEGDEANRVKLNPAAYELIKQTYREAFKTKVIEFGGMFNEPQTTAQLIASLETKAVEKPDYGATIRKVSAVISEQSTKRGGMAIFIADNGAVAEEEFHLTSYLASRGKDLAERHARFEELVNHPAYQAAKPILAAQYKTDTDGLLIEELQPKILSGQAAKYNVRPELARDFAKLWFVSFGEQNGELSKEEFKELNDESKRIRDEAYARIDGARSETVREINGDFRNQSADRRFDQSDTLGDVSGREAGDAARRTLSNGRELKIEDELRQRLNQARVGFYAQAANAEAENQPLQKSPSDADHNAGSKDTVAEIAANELVARLEVREAEYKLNEFNRTKAGKRYKVKDGETEIETSVLDLDKKARAEATIKVEEAAKNGLLNMRVKTDEIGEKQAKYVIFEESYKKAVESQGELRSQIEIKQEKEAAAKMYALTSKESVWLKIQAEARKYSENAEAGLPEVKPKIAPEIVWRLQEQAINRGDLAAFGELEDLHRSFDIPRSNMAYARLTGAVEITETRARIKEAAFADQVSDKSANDLIKVVLHTENGKIKVKELSAVEMMVGEAEKILIEAADNGKNKNKEAIKLSGEAFDDLMQPLKNLVNPFAPMNNALGWLTNPVETVNAQVNPFERIKNDQGVQIIRAVSKFVGKGGKAIESYLEAQALAKDAQEINKLLIPEKTAVDEARAIADLVKTAVAHEQKTRDKYILEGLKDGEEYGENLKVPNAEIRLKDVREMAKNSLELRDAELLEKYQDAIQKPELAEALQETKERAAAREIISDIYAATDAGRVLENTRISASELEILTTSADLKKAANSLELAETAERFRDELNPVGRVEPHFAPEEVNLLESLGTQLTKETQTAVNEIIGEQSLVNTAETVKNQEVSALDKLLQSNSENFSSSLENTVKLMEQQRLLEQQQANADLIKNANGVFGSPSNYTLSNSVDLQEKAERDLFSRMAAERANLGTTNGGNEERRINQTTEQADSDELEISDEQAELLAEEAEEAVTLGEVML
jgi:hypothetical protein